MPAGVCGDQRTDCCEVRLAQIAALDALEAFHATEATKEECRESSRKLRGQFTGP